MDEYSKFLDDLKQRANITDVVSEYSQVIRRGAYLWACCPLHVEKTPSFCIYEKSNTYYCYGCHSSGDVIKFVEEIEKTDFKGAIDILAKKYNLEVPQFHKNEDFAAAKKKRDRLYDLMREAAIHYHNNLMSERGLKAREYLLNRGITQETINQFGLGYSIDSTDLVTFLKARGFTGEEMSDAKVAFRKGTGSYYDPQYERFVTPIINSTKNVVAFGGRIIVKNDQLSKYYNSMESFIFHKSNELFGQHVVKTLRNIKDVILVEGYMDVISLYQAGIKNAVASMGTALTPEQAHLLKRYCTTVYYMYDGDSAGQKGMIRGVDILKEAGLNVKVVVLENDLDPDEYIKKFGAEAMREKIYKTAMPMYEYKIKVIAKDYDLKSTQGKGDFAVAAIGVLKEIPNVAQIEPFLILIEKMTGISSQYLYQQLAEAKKGQQISFVQQSSDNKRKSDTFTKALRYVMFALFGGVDGVKPEDEFYDCCRTPEMQELYNIFRARQGALTINDLEVLKDENSEVNQILIEGNSIKDENLAKKYFADSRKLVLMEMLESRKKQLATALDNETDGESKNNLLLQLTQTMNYIKKIK